jgi:hypothetical protein
MAIHRVRSKSWLPRARRTAVVDALGYENSSASLSSVGRGSPAQSTSKKVLILPDLRGPATIKVELRM